MNRIGEYYEVHDNNQRKIFPAVSFDLKHFKNLKKKIIKDTYVCPKSKRTLSR